MGTLAKNPSWWTNEHTSTWEKTKEAFRRDWEQTKADLSGHKKGHELNQNIGDTVKQAAGKEVIPPGNQPNTGDQKFEDLEPAFRLGHGARLQFKDKPWGKDVEDSLKKDWEASGAPQKWDDAKNYVQRGFDTTQQN